MADKGIRIGRVINVTGMIGVAAGIVLSAFGIVLLLFRRGFGFDIATPFHWFWWLPGRAAPRICNEPGAVNNSEHSLGRSMRSRGV
jgi:hypothetical protein